MCKAFLILLGEIKLTIYHYCGNSRKPFPLDGLSQNICSAANCQGLRCFGTSGQQCYSKRPGNTSDLGDNEFSLKQILHRPGTMKIIQKRKRLTTNFTKSASSNVSGIIFSHCCQNLTRSGCFFIRNV